MAPAFPLKIAINNMEMDTFCLGSLFPLHPWLVIYWLYLVCHNIFSCPDSQGELYLCSVFRFWHQKSLQDSSVPSGLTVTISHFAEISESLPNMREVWTKGKSEQEGNVAWGYPPLVFPAWCGMMKWEIKRCALRLDTDTSQSPVSVWCHPGAKAETARPW